MSSSEWRKRRSKESFCNNAQRHTTTHPDCLDTNLVKSVEMESDASKSEKTKHNKTKKRYDVVLWVVGLVFIALIHAACFGLGYYKGWNAPSPYHHNMTQTSQDRFLPEPFTPEPGVKKRSDPEASSRWYYWKLKPELVTVWTRVFVWSGYILHNVAVWVVLYLQQREKTFPSKLGPKYTAVPDKFNIAHLVINAIFHVVHLINTHVTYDGTALDTSEASSQSSVIVALILILFIEFAERGIAFGYPSPDQLRKYKGSIWLSPTHLIRKYHGYFIYWAAIFTFWYHPFENTIGHAFGFTHTWMLMLQGSLAFQTFHLNKYWRLLLEYWVAIHGFVVAYQTVPDIMGKELWPMFLFGFLTVLFITSLYGLPFWKKLPAWSRAFPIIAYIVGLIIAYYFIRDVNGQRFVRLAEVIRIPGIYYLLLIVAWLIIVALMKLDKIIKGSVTPVEDKDEPEGFDGITRKDESAADSEPSVKTSKMALTHSKRPSIMKEVGILVAVTATYAVCVIISWLLEYVDLKVNLIVLTMVYCFSFMIISAIFGSVLLKQILPMKTY